MIAVNTNEALLMARNYSRLNNLESKERVERLTSGFRINKGADDPSGLAISGSMKAHFRGVDSASANIQDNINLLNTVDKYLDDIQDILTHMRDLSVRLANEAPLTADDNRDPASVAPAKESSADDLYTEFYRFAEHLDTMFDAEVVSSNPARIIPPPLSFNGKNLLDNIGASAGSQRGFAEGQVGQIGPDNDASHQIQIVIDDIATITAGFQLPYDGQPPTPGGKLAGYVAFAQDQIDKLDQKIDTLSNTRAQVGTLVNRLYHALQDLSADSINTKAANSRIVDADFAEEVVAMTKNQIVQQSQVAAESQANAVPLITLELLGAVYDGMNPSQIGFGNNEQAA